MSQPNAVTQHMATRPKNATQHPGCIVIESQGKRHTAAQKAADDQREKEVKEASNNAVQESYQYIATMQAQMQADQDNAHIDAPKPKHPRACPVGKAAKTLKTPDSTMDGGQAGAEMVATDKPVVTKDKGQKGRSRQLAAAANVQHPASDEDLEEEPVAAKPQRKKATKPAVTMSLLLTETALFFFDVTINNSDTASPKKFSFAGRVLGWILTVPMNTSKPSSMSKATTHSHSTSIGSAFSKLTRGSTISSNVPPLSTPISIPDAGSTFSNLYASDTDEDEDKGLFTKPLSGFKGKKALTFQPILQIASKALDDVFPRGAISEPEQPDPIEDAQHAEILSDIHDQIIFMNSGIGDIPPPPQLAFLGDYKSNSDDSHELQAVDYDSDLVPPPLAQKPTSHSAFPVDFELLAASQKRKQPPLLSNDDLLSPSSDDEIMEVTNDRMITVKAELLLNQLIASCQTNIATTLKAPPAKRLKSESSTTTITGSHHAIATPTKAIACSAFRKKHLPKGCQMANKWAREFIPTAICHVGDLCETLQWLSEWHNSISNVALIVLTNFMISQEDLNTDQDCQDFASGLLKRLCFLFGGISEDGEIVLVQHKCATSGAVNMPGINNILLGHSKGALALMERAIKLFANGQMLLSDINTAGNGRNNKTPLHINPSTGKESSVPLVFSDTNWGVQTRAYITSISCLPDSVVYRNSELAQNLAMKRCGIWMEVDDETEDERALIF
ncbi:hypothetical protein F4604DRAFT_1683836 [Suillus subluteus]|nr:hypothetical protein F4604DRAFT_1683836 [Suillus subluteus]